MPNTSHRRLIYFALSIGAVLLVFVIILRLQPTTESSRSFDTRLSTPVLIEGEEEFYTVDDRLSHYDVPAVSIVVLDEGAIAFAGGYGSLSDGVRPDEHTVFQAGSISKPMTASVALRLVDAHVIDLNTDLSDILASHAVPLPPIKTIVTFEALFAHVSGFTVSGFSGFAHTERLPTISDIISGYSPAKESAIILDRSGIGKWSYSGGGYVVAQIAIESISQLAYEDLAQVEVFEPLNMQHSTFLNPADDVIVAHGNTPDGEVDDGWLLYPQPTAAGLWSSASDLARWLKAIYLSATTEDGHWSSTGTSKMWEPVVDFGGSRQALGFRSGGEDDALWIRASGDTRGFHAQVVLFPQTGDGIVVMVNANNDQASPFADELVRAVAAEYNWPHFTPRYRALATPGQADVNRVVGRYAFDDYQDISLLIDADEVGTLWMVLIQGKNVGERKVLYVDADGSYFTLNDTEMNFELEGDVASHADFLQNGNSFATTRIANE